MQERQKQLEMALIRHKPVIYDKIFILTWDNEINQYRGKSVESNLEIGIWEIKFLLKKISCLEVLK